MRLFWTLQVCIGAAAIVSAAALGGACSSSSGDTGTGIATGTATDTCTSTDDTCFAGGGCCDLQLCAAAHCQSACLDACGFYAPGNPGCSGCLQAACAAENAACK